MLLILIGALGPVDVMRAQYLTPAVDCLPEAEAGQGLFGGSTNFQGAGFQQMGDADAEFVYLGLYRISSTSKTIKAQIRHYPNYPSVTGMTIPWESASVSLSTAALNPTLPMTESTALRIQVTPPLALTAGQYYGVGHLRGADAADGVNFYTRHVGTVACSIFHVSNTGLVIPPAQIPGHTLYVNPYIVVDPTPVPEYDAGALIDGLVDGGAETDLGKGLVGGAVGVGLVALIGALVGSGALLVAIAGPLALLLLVALGVLPTWTLVLVLPVVLVAAYIRYALGGKG
jgi:hypothetical protein